MICELFPFQKTAVFELRKRVAMALNNYHSFGMPQVISLQAPTGSGKTLIMAALIEEIFCGSENNVEQPNAIFVWLSDSPQLNEQSKQKIELKANKIRVGQCEIISDESFDRENLEDGKIYFLNTQKLGKAGNLSRHSDTRQYTIWETIENTAREKSDRLYFIIDEAHRGMQGKDAGIATSIMQRFIKGSPMHGLSPVPIVIGMSATAERFHALVGDTDSGLQRYSVTPAQVRQSGLLKDRIIITYPENPSKHNDIAVLQAATDEWIDKCKHWYQYTHEQHYASVNPVFVVQVCAGSGDKESSTDLDEVIAKIEERLGYTFKEGEVVHTFGSVGDLTLCGLKVPHIEPSEIAEDRRVRVVLFKENLSTGWDCPRAETMMSFRRASDATYVAQLLGRMIRTPLQCHILVDESLNDVRLFLPYFNHDTVQSVIDELQAAEGGELPTVIDSGGMDDSSNTTWSVHIERPRTPKTDTNQTTIFTYAPDANGTIVQTFEGSGFSNEGESATYTDPSGSSQPSFSYLFSGGTNSLQYSSPQAKPNGGSGQKTTDNDSATQESLLPTIDRVGIVKFINEQGFLTYMIRSVRISKSYVSSLMDLAGLLSHYNIYKQALEDVNNDVTDMIRQYVTGLRETGKYDGLAKQVMEMKLSIQIFDVFGKEIKIVQQPELFASSDSVIDPQYRVANTKMGGCGFPDAYGKKYQDVNNPNVYKIDCILYAVDSECIAELNTYAEKKFHELNDRYRIKVASNTDEKCRNRYSDIVADSSDVSEQLYTLPETINAKVDKDGIVYNDHLFADKKGIAKIKLNGWEQAVLEEERKRDDFVCWLRNPSRKSWSLCVSYKLNGEDKEMFPDFIIVRRDPDLGYVLDILEPHNADFKDNLGKAKGLAEYAKKEPRIGRVQLIRIGKDAAKNNRFKRLDLAKGVIRDKVLKANNTDELDHIFDTDGVFED